MVRSFTKDIFLPSMGISEDSSNFTCPEMRKRNRKKKTGFQGQVPTDGWVPKDRCLRDHHGALGTNLH